MAKITGFEGGIRDFAREEALAQGAEGHKAYAQLLEGGELDIKKQNIGDMDFIKIPSEGRGCPQG